MNFDYTINQLKKYIEYCKDWDFRNEYKETNKEINKNTKVKILELSAAIKILEKEGKK